MDEAEALPISSWQQLRLRALLNAYGTGYDFCRFSFQEESGALFCRFGSDGILHLPDGADAAEWSDYLCMAGIERLSAGGAGMRALEALLPCRERQSGTVLEASCGGKDNIALVQVTDYAGFSRAYVILCAAFAALEPSDFDGWYCDISHRVRHGAAQVFLLEDAACAVVYQAGKLALLDKLAVLPERQGDGLGSGLLAALQDGPWQRLTVCSKDADTDRFYQRNGFVPCDQWQEYLLK